ncbi:MAG TPA: anti-sigma factor [Bacillales bacterium]|nr:anti-sigma factor [Bacillales bacterium]
MACNSDIVILMHKVLDENADEKDKQDLTLHLQKCLECREHFEELKRTVAIVQSASRVKAPENFKESVMDRLPREKSRPAARRWLQTHPVMTAAALFLIFMTGYLFQIWHAPQEVAVIGEGHVVKGNDIVIVPEGEVINGDLIVHNSDVRIEGKVKGDVTVINGRPFKASAGQVTGQIKEVNEILGWIWYQIKHLFTGSVSYQEIRGFPL